MLPLQLIMLQGVGGETDTLILTAAAMAAAANHGIVTHVGREEIVGQEAQIKGNGAILRGAIAVLLLPLQRTRIEGNVLVLPAQARVARVAVVLCLVHLLAQAPGDPARRVLAAARAPHDPGRLLQHLPFGRGHASAKRIRRICRAGSTLTAPILTVSFSIGSSLRSSSLRSSGPRRGGSPLPPLPLLSPCAMTLRKAAALVVIAAGTLMMSLRQPLLSRVALAMGPAAREGAGVAVAVDRKCSRAVVAWRSE